MSTPPPPGPPPGPPYGPPPGPPYGPPPGPPYGPPPGPPSGFSRSPRSPGSTGGAKRFALLAVLAGSVIGLVATAVVHLGGETEEPPITPAPPPSPTRTRTPPPVPTPTPLGTSTATPSPTVSETCPTRPVAAVIPGWQAIGSERDGTAFDVPADYEFSPGVLFGVETKDQRVAAHCAVQYLRRPCGQGSSSRASIGLSTVGSRTNPDGDPVAFAQLWAELANTDYKTGVRGPVPEPTVTTARSVGGAEVRVATIEAIDTTPDGPCPAPRFRVSAAAVELPAGRRALLVVSSGRGTDQDLPLDVEQQIITSLRPL